ncbi:uncharacterized protein [Rutidosis leptorrhynchoides]|uniref:uncharacterized protein n=1 Tax=Rutidosis leptorrhynchoides TaxID=125765 RepID=UPI003A9A46D0
MVSDRIIWVDNTVTINWAWTSQPKWRAETELLNATSLLNNLAAPTSDSDRWIWKFGTYSTCAFVSHLTELAASSSPITDPTITNSLIPQKIGIFIWRAKQNKLPVRTELDKRGIDLDLTRCPVCDDDQETLQHALLACKHSIEIWNRILKWWKLNSLHIANLKELSKCSNPSFNSHTGLAIWQAVVWTTSYFIWKNRNDFVFGNAKQSCPKIVSDIQSKTFEWINSRWKKGNLEWLQWISNPLSFDVNPNTKAGIG